MKIILDFPSEPDIITRVLIKREIGGSELERFEDVMLLPLKMEEAAMSQGRQVTSRSQRKRNRFSPKASRESVALTAS